VREFFAGKLAIQPVGPRRHDVEAVKIGPDSAAKKLWPTVRDAGVGPVTTSKLLARKRPPVIDTVVKKVLGHSQSDDFWLTLREQLTANGGTLHDRLLAARK